MAPGGTGHAEIEPSAKQAPRGQVSPAASCCQPEVQALHRIAGVLRSISSHQRALELVCKECLELLGATYAAIWQVEGATLVRKAAWYRGRQKPDRLYVSQPLSPELLGPDRRASRYIGKPKLALNGKGPSTDAFFGFTDPASQLTVQLGRGSRTTGLLGIALDSDRTLEQAHKVILKGLAGCASAALEVGELKGRLRREAGDQARLLRTLSQARRIVQTRVGLNRKLESLVAAATSIGNAYYAAVFLADPNSRALKLAAEHRAPGPGEREGPSLEAYMPLLQRCLETATPLVGKNNGVAKGAVKAANGDREPSPQILGLPLVTGSQPLGVIVAARGQGAGWSAADVELMKLLALDSVFLIDTARSEASEYKHPPPRDADPLKSSPMATIAHELRTPLASIKGYLSTLLQEDVEWDHDKRHRFLRTADQAADRLDNLLSDILTMSQLEVGSLFLDLQPQPLANVFAQLDDELRSIADNHDLCIRLDQKLSPVYCDARRVAQILINLVSNAAKFSPEGSEITVEASRCPAGALVSIKDRGIGIPPDQIERVFDRFYQINSPSAQSRRGTGLGLSICRELVESQGGRIWAESSLGYGSTFLFTLPLATTGRNDTGMPDAARPRISRNGVRRKDGPGPVRRTRSAGPQPEATAGSVASEPSP